MIVSVNSDTTASTAPPKYPAAVQAGNPNQQGDQHRADRDLKRRSQTVENADQLVTTKRPVRTQNKQRRVCPLRCRQQIPERAKRRILRHRHIRPRPDSPLLLIRRIEERRCPIVADKPRHNRTTEKRQPHDQHHSAERHEPPPIPPQTPPNAAPRPNRRSIGAHTQFGFPAAQSAPTPSLRSY